MFLLAKTVKGHRYYYVMSSRRRDNRPAGIPEGATNATTREAWNQYYWKPMKNYFAGSHPLPRLRTASSD